MNALAPPPLKVSLPVSISYEVQLVAHLQYWKASTDGLSVLSGSSSAEYEAVSVPFPPSVPILNCQPHAYGLARFFRGLISESDDSEIF